MAFWCCRIVSLTCDVGGLYTIFGTNISDSSIELRNMDADLNCFVCFNTYVSAFKKA